MGDNKSSDKQNLARATVGCVCTLCSADETVSFGGKTYEPKFSSLYFRFTLLRGFPSATLYGTAAHPASIEKSYRDLVHAPVSYEHQIALYNSTATHDQIIGSIIDVSFPQAPNGGWKIRRDKERAPAVTGIGALHIAAEKSKTVMDRYERTKKMACSMEAFWDLDNCGYCLALGGAKPEFAAFTPADMADAGFEYCPHAVAPPLLKSVWDHKKGRVVASYKSRKVTVLMAGLDGQFNLAGIGIVSFGAEPGATILDFGESEKSLNAAPQRHTFTGTGGLV
jgi:hypothetical protein